LPTAQAPGPAFPGRDCEPQQDPEMTSREIRQDGAIFYLESCAFESDISPSSFWYFYRVENRGQNGLVLRWDRAGILIPILRPLPPGLSMFYTTRANSSPNTVDTDIYFGTNQQKVTFKTRVPSK
jgi:hypothetical protein